MRNLSRPVFTPGNDTGNSSGSAGHSNHSALTFARTKGRPSGRFGVNSS